MLSDRFQKASELLCAALEIDSEQQRGGFLKQACSGDEPLLLEVKSLLAAHFKAGQFIQTPPVQNVYDLLSDQEERLSTGEQIGAYKIVREIGRGGMGAVYLADRADEQYKKHVAIKLLKRGMDTDDLLRHFRRERQILATFDHPNIARLHDGGSTETGLPYFVMEYVEGKPIDDYCDEHELSITQRLELFQQVCSAVSYAHRNLVVHRDIKPSNILVTSEGIPKLLDFGIAKILQTEEPGMTATNIRWMTPEFASPEQAQGLPVTTASDVYSLGVVLYEILTGYSPYQFTGRTPVEIARVISETQPQLPSVIINTVEIKPQTAKSVRTTHEGSLERLRRRLQGDLDNIVLMALRKEPERRYQSVEQFSEDIKRHLEGLPVIARKDTFSYRASKFVQRNKVAVALAAFTILAIAVSATVAGIIQWRANQQAKFLQEFGAEAARIEGIMRFAYLMPLHDTSPEREIVMKRIRAINARTSELGSSAQGPGHYAIGRALMALQQYENARQHFQEALTDYGYRTSEVSYSYGLTLAMLYQTELETAARISSKELRETRMKEIQRDYRDPALSYIREGRRSAEYSEYAEAVVEFLDGRYEKAIQKSEKAMQRIPWLYESKNLEGESYRTIGMKFSNEGKHAEALDSFTKAENAFEISIQNGSSDPSGYEALCSLKPNVIWLFFETGGEADAEYMTGKKYCEQALKVDPQNGKVYLHFSRLDYIYERYLWTRGQKSRRDLIDDSVQKAKMGVQLRPDDVEAYKNLTFSYYYLISSFEEIPDKKTSEIFAAGEKSIQKAIQINPNDAGAYYMHGQLLWIWAQHIDLAGGDPAQVFDRAIQSLQTSIRLNPKDHRPYHMMGNVLAARGDWEAGTGMNPTKSIDSSIEMLHQALEINPGFLAGYFSLAYVASVKGDYLSLMGMEPYEAFEQAELAYEKALKLNPTFADILGFLAEVSMKKGEYRVDTRNDPSEDLNETNKTAERCLALEPKNLYCFRALGGADLVSARWKILQEKPPQVEFRNSLSWLDRTINIENKADSSLGYQSKARLFRWWAQWKIESNQSGDREIQLGLDMVSKALEINPHSGEMAALRGVFWLFQARSASNLSQRHAFADKAQTNLQEALKLNANLSHAFTPYLKEAEGLAKSPDRNAR